MHLLNRLPAERFKSQVAALDADVVKCFNGSCREVRSFPGFSWFPYLAAPGLARWVSARRIGLIHAWGLRAALAARMVADVPLILELFDPALSLREIKLLRTLVRPSGFAIICSCATVRRRLVEQGLPGELCVVIRPGIDFGLITRLRHEGIRTALGLPSSAFVVIAPEPATRGGGHFEICWAGELANYVLPNVRVIIPGESREQRRIARFAATLPHPDVLVCPGNDYRFEQLLAIADVLVTAPSGDASSTAIAWAMAAGVPVIAAARYSTAELLSNKLNGLLFKPKPGESQAIAIVRLLQDRAAQDKGREVARGQAYEVFGLRRNIEQHGRVYENVLNGVQPGAGIVDAAMSA